MDATPTLNLTGDDIEHSIKIPSDGTVRVADESTFQALNFGVDLRNVGNMPITYDVESFQVLINGKVVTRKLEPSDRTKNILFQDQERHFQLESVYFDQRERKPLSLLEIMKLNIQCHIRVRYDMLGMTDSPNYVDRSFEWSIYSNMMKYTWGTFNDSIEGLN